MESRRGSPCAGPASPTYTFTEIVLTNRESPSHYIHARKTPWCDAWRALYVSSGRWLRRASRSLQSRSPVRSSVQRPRSVRSRRPSGRCRSISKPRSATARASTRRRSCSSARRSGSTIGPSSTSTSRARTSSSSSGSPRSMSTASSSPPIRPRNSARGSTRGSSPSRRAWRRCPPRTIRPRNKRARRRRARLPFRGKALVRPRASPRSVDHPRGWGRHLGGRVRVRGAHPVEIDATANAVSQEAAEPHFYAAQDYALIANVMMPIGGTIALVGLVWGIVDIVMAGGSGADTARLRPSLRGGELAVRF